MTDLLPCPFCGDNLYACTYADGKTRWAHTFGKCAISKAFIYDADLWNARTPPQITDAMEEAAVQAYNDATLGGDRSSWVGMRAALEAAMGVLE